MADIIDAANEHAQLMIETALKNRIPDKPHHYKYCRNCQESTPDGWQFCDVDCRDDFENRNKK